MASFSLYLALFGQLCLLAFVIWGVGFLYETWLNQKPDRVLYHGSNVREQGELVLGVIERYITSKGQKTDSYTLVEPGAGMATMSHFLAHSLTWKAVRAVEIGPFIIIAGKIRFLFAREKTPVRFVRQNLFDYSIQAPALVYCYLFSSLVTKMYKSGQLKGSLVVSLTFPIEGVKPTEEIELKSWQGKLLVYDFRSANEVA